MGDRANILVTSDNETVCLYTHWAGTELPKTLQDALKRGESRLDDFQYITRIIFNQMTKGREMELTGFGITCEVHDNEHELIKFNVDDQTIVIGEAKFTAKEYLEKVFSE